MNNGRELNEVTVDGRTTYQHLVTPDTFRRVGNHHHAHGYAVEYRHHFIFVVIAKVDGFQWFLLLD